MVKKILKSVLVLSTLLVVVGMGTRAWFTSNITAADNEVEVGTLRSALGSTADVDGAGSGYTVVYDNDGTETQVGNFPLLGNMQPSNYNQTDEEKSVYMVVFNRGSLPFNYRFKIVGANWVGSGGNPALMELRHVHRYATNSWEGEWGPYNIKTWLDGVGYSWESGVTAETWNYGSGCFWIKIILIKGLAHRLR